MGFFLMLSWVYIKRAYHCWGCKHFCLHHSAHVLACTAQAQVRAHRNPGLSLGLSKPNPTLPTPYPNPQQVWPAQVQAEDRAHRIGQAQSVNIYFLHAKGSVDDVIWATLQDKLEHVGQVGTRCLVWPGGVWISRAPCRTSWSTWGRWGRVA